MNQTHLVAMNICLERLHHVTISHDKARSNRWCLQFLSRHQWIKFCILKKVTSFFPEWKENYYFQNDLRNVSDRLDKLWLQLAKPISYLYILYIYYIYNHLIEEIVSEELQHVSVPSFAPIAFIVETAKKNFQFIFLFKKILSIRQAPMKEDKTFIFWRKKINLFSKENTSY